MLFAPDALRELCIESGYAMRGSVRTFDLADLQIETPEEELAPEPEEAATEPAEPKPEAPADPFHPLRRCGRGRSDRERALRPGRRAHCQTGQGPAPRQGQKAVKASSSPMPRFEQIDMFTAVEQASADALPALPLPNLPKHPRRMWCGRSPS